ncbi:MAG: CopD family protein [Anaerolineae bacterium]|nr:CopD family protein [Anaerolineae bacterium]
MRRLLLLAVLLLSSVLVITPQTAEAHGYLIRVIPDNRAVLSRPPTRIQAWFSEGLEPRFSTISLTDERGNPIPLEDVGVVPSNTSQLSARIPQPLPDGAYIVNLRVAFASDGHIYNERLVFWVGTQSGDLAVSGEGSIVDPLEAVWRAISLPPFYALFGASLLYAAVLRPAWDNPRYRAGRLPPRLMSRLTALAWIAVAVAAFGTLLAVLQQSAALFAVSLEAVLRDGLWDVVLNGTTIGDTLRLRLILLAAIAAMLYGTRYLSERLPDFVAPLWIAIMGAAASALFTFSMSSHAVGSDLWAVPSVFAHWLHMLATGAWAGGLIGLAVLLPAALAPLDEAGKRAALTAALRRFAVLGVGAVLVLTTTGAYNSAIQVRQVSDYVTTPYGLILLAKYALVAPMLLLALYHHLVVGQDRLTVAIRQRYADWRERLPHLPRSIRLEAILGVLVLIATAILASNAPPLPAQRASVPLLTASGSSGALSATLTFDPGGVGGNTYELLLKRNGEPVTGAQVQLRLAYPELDRRARAIPLDDADNGVYLSAGLELDRAGIWWALLDVTLPDQTEPQRLALTVDLPAVAPALNLRQPSIFNWLSAFAVIAALTLLSVPPIVRRLRRVRFTPETAFIFTALLIVTVIFSIGGAFIVSEASAQTDRLRNPPPQIVNPVLPDAESLARGAAAYAQHCAACHGERGNGDGARAAEFARMPRIRTLVETRRDESLFSAIQRGVGAMPAVRLPEQTAWDVVNFLRSPVFLGR